MEEEQRIEGISRTMRIPEEVNDPAWREKRRLAAAIRKLTELCVVTDAEAHVLGESADKIEQQVRLLSQEKRTTFVDAFQKRIYHREPEVYADRSVLVGLANPVAPPLRLEYVDGVSIGTVVFNEVFSGAPGMLHGGILASVFDQILGHQLLNRGIGALTVNLEVQFHQPTLIERELRFEGNLESQEGRRFILHGSCMDGEMLTAEAKAVFIQVPRGVFEKARG